MNRFLTVITGILILNSGCYVGTKVRVKSDHLKYPVSYTSSFYTQDLELIDSVHYTVKDHFSLSFTKWGISMPLNIGSEEDISDRMNQLVRENSGDAIVNLVVSVNSTPINDVLLVPKSLGFLVGIIAIPGFFIEPTAENAAIAAGAIALYLFTPGAATITMEGDVVRIIGND